MRCVPHCPNAAPETSVLLRVSTGLESGPDLTQAPAVTQAAGPLIFLVSVQRPACTGHVLHP